MPTGKRKPAPDRVYIRELAQIIDRRMDTIRRWDRLGVLPPELQSHRDENGRQWRYWTKKQVQGIIRWLKRTDRRPGKGLPHWEPSEDEITDLLEKLRRPRKAA